MVNTKNGVKKSKKPVGFLPGDLVVLRSSTSSCKGYVQLTVNADGFVLGGRNNGSKYIVSKPGSLGLLIRVARCAGMPDSEAPWALAVISDKILWIPGWNMRPIKTTVHPAP